MSREALQMPFGGTNALEAFAAMLLGERPFDPSEESLDLARVARELARDRTERRRVRGPARDLEQTAFRALYRLARARAAHVPHHPAPPGVETKPARALRLMLSLRHRQRAVLALRYVLGMSREDVGYVLGATPAAADEISRAGLAAIARAAGSKMDVRRNLRAAGASIPPARFGADGSEPPAERTEPRSVVQLLLAPPPIEEVPRAVSIMRVAFEPRPVYTAAVEEPAKAAGIPALARSWRTGWRGAIAAAIAAVVAFGVLALSPNGAHLTSPPLAVVPLAPRITSPATRTAAGPVAPTYLVRAGDTLWALAGRALGEPYRWPELWRANAGRKMGDGSRFVDPDLIRPGWRLVIPRSPVSGGG